MLLVFLSVFFTSANKEINLKKLKLKNHCEYFCHLCIFFLLKYALNETNPPFTINASPVILLQTCAALYRSIIVTTGSKNDNDDFIYGSDVYLNQYSLFILISRQKYLETLLNLDYTALPLFLFLPRLHARKTV